MQSKQPRPISTGPLAQSAELLTFNQTGRGSNPRRPTKTTRAASATDSTPSF
jgi:hypothetical protein